MQKLELGGTDYETWARARVAAGLDMPGPYVRNPDHKATMLGERQWQWLERQLEVPADLRLFGSSVQVLADFTGWEAWACFARDRERLFDLIRRKNANGLVFLSGDIHYAELSKLDVNVPYTLWDLTSSGLTEEWRVPTPNANRASEVVADANFGFIDIDWQGPSTRVSLGIVDAKGRTRMSWDIALASLAGAVIAVTATRPVRAVFFDLDGTLVDSEIHTDRAISAVTARYGIADFALPHTETRGRTWLHVAGRIRALTTIDRAPTCSPTSCSTLWVELATDVKPVPGAPDAVRAAAAVHLKLGVVSGSPRSVIDSFLDKLGVGDYIDPRARIGGDVVSQSKPDPEGYLLAAQRLRHRSGRRRRLRGQPGGPPCRKSRGHALGVHHLLRDRTFAGEHSACDRELHALPEPAVAFLGRLGGRQHRSRRPVVRMNAANPELLRRYRMQLFTATWLSYCGFYITRKVYAVVKHPLKEQFGLDDVEIAWPWTIYLITYMLGQFVAAWLGRRMESRRVLAWGMCAAAACNIVLGRLVDSPGSRACSCGCA